MMTITHRHMLLLGAVLLLTNGCVSSSKYKKLESSKNERISTLENQVASLEMDKSNLSTQKEAMERANKEKEDQYNALVSQLADEVQKGDLKVTQYKNMMTVDVAEKIFFASGSALLKDSGKQVLQKLAKALASYPDKYVRVVGHTDNVPLSKATQATFPSNWELSAARSTNVVRMLQDAGVPADRLIVSARGEFQPIAPNDSADGRQKNRRIEIMLLDKNLVESVTNK